MEKGALLALTSLSNAIFQSGGNCRLFAIERSEMSEMSERHAPSEDGDGAPHPNQLDNGIPWHALMEKATPVSSESRLFAIECSEMSAKGVLRKQR